MTVTQQYSDFDVEGFFRNEVQNFKEFLSDLEHRLADPNTIDDHDALIEFTAAFHQSREECRVAEESLKDNTRQLAEIQQRFRDELAPWFDQSWFFDRAKKKPRGYPGDFVMLMALYDEQPKSTGIGRILDLYFLQADLARAVRTRLADVKAFVIDEIQMRRDPVRILNVASGPGHEYSTGFAEQKRDITVTCLDTDEEALAYLREHIDPTALDMYDFQCVHYNALKTASAEKNLANFGASDIIYSVGLCDYIPDRYMIRILEGWRESVCEGGVVYVAFKDCKKYVASEYQWHADWHFYQRTEEECRELFARAGYDVEQMEMFRDETGIIMNFVNRIEGPVDLRLDSQQSVKNPHFAAGDEEQVSDSESAQRNE